MQKLKDNRSKLGQK